MYIIDECTGTGMPLRCDDEAQHLSSASGCLIGTRHLPPTELGTKAFDVLFQAHGKTPLISDGRTLSEGWAHRAGMLHEPTAMVSSHL